MCYISGLVANLNTFHTDMLYFPVTIRLGRGSQAVEKAAESRRNYRSEDI